MLLFFGFESRNRHKMFCAGLFKVNRRFFKECFVLETVIKNRLIYWLNFAMEFKEFRKFYLKLFNLSVETMKK